MKIGNIEFKNGYVRMTPNALFWSGVIITNLTWLIMIRYVV